MLHFHNKNDCTLDVKTVSVSQDYCSICFLFSDFIQQNVIYRTIADTGKFIAKSGMSLPFNKCTSYLTWMIQLILMPKMFTCTDP